MMVEIKKRPMKGQWVEMWVHAGVIWSHTVSVDDEGHLHFYDHEGEEWEDGDGVMQPPVEHRYFINVRDH